MSMAGKFLSKSFEPVRAIEWVISFYTLLGGAFVFTPLYHVSVSNTGPGIISQLVSGWAATHVFAGMLIIGAVLVIIGLLKDVPRVRSAGWFIIFISRLFQVYSTWVVVGLLPISWIHPLTVACVVAVLWGWARIEVYRSGA